MIEPHYLTIDEVPGLSLPQRLALAHCPVDLRPAALAVFGLDARLGQFVSQAKEPLVAQLRLAWWREQLAKPALDRPQGDAVLDRVSVHCPGIDGELAGLVDGWEQMLADPPLAAGCISDFATSRGATFSGLCRLAGKCEVEEEAARAGRLWALADLAAGVSEPDERALVVEVGAGAAKQRLRLPYRLRHLTILGELGRSALRRGGVPLLSRRRDYLLIARLGLLGR